MTPDDLEKRLEQITLEEFRKRLKAQGVPRLHFAFKCPMCGTAQSAYTLIQEGAGETFKDVEKFLGFSCVGRWTGAKSPRKEPDGEPCNWTLGGLLHTHNLEVLTEDGEVHPRFEIASPEEAQALAPIRTEKETG